MNATATIIPITPKQRAIAGIKRAFDMLRCSGSNADNIDPAKGPVSYAFAIGYAEQALAFAAKDLGDPSLVDLLVQLEKPE